MKVQIVGMLTLLTCSACQQRAATDQLIAPAPPFKPTASVQDLMRAMVDPAADGVWDAVGTTITRQGSEFRQPHTDEEWQQVRLHAVALVEAANLLTMDGRRLVPEGGKIADEGADGVISTNDGERKLQAEYAAFAQYARALHETATQVLKAVDAHDAHAVLATGEALDEVCESCHVQFWYPKQVGWVAQQSGGADAN